MDIIKIPAPANNPPGKIILSIIRLLNDKYQSGTSDDTSRKSTQYVPLNTDLTFENQSKFDSLYKLRSIV